MGGGGEAMIIKRVVLNLSSAETLRLTRILLDEDKEDALLFLKECLKPQLDQATRDHWVPVFEASYKPSQKDTFGRYWRDYHASSFL
jgi:hypothetical protein